MIIILFITIMPKTLSVFRRVFGLTDELTMIRGVVVSLYCWFFSPFLFSRLPEVIATFVIFLFAFLTNIIFLMLNGNKSKKSIYISAFDYLWKILIAIYKIIILGLIIVESKLRIKGSTPYMLKFFYVDRKYFMDRTLFILFPFLYIVNYKNTHYINGENFLVCKKMWIILISTSFIASIIWAFFIYKSGLRI